MLLLCGIDACIKYVWIVPLKGKTYIRITNAFQKVLKEIECKPNKISADKGSAFYNRSVKSWLLDSDIEIYSTHLLLLKYVLEPLKYKIYKYKTSVSNNVYINKLDI